MRILSCLKLYVRRLIAWQVTPDKSMWQESSQAMNTRCKHRFKIAELCRSPLPSQAWLLHVDAFAGDVTERSS